MVGFFREFLLFSVIAALLPLASSQAIGRMIKKGLRGDRMLQFNDRVLRSEEDPQHIADAQKSPTDFEDGDDESANAFEERFCQDGSCPSTCRYDDAFEVIYGEYEKHREACEKAGVCTECPLDRAIQAIAEARIDDDALKKSKEQSCKYDGAIRQMIDQEILRRAGCNSELVALSLRCLDSGTTEESSSDWGISPPNTRTAIKETPWLLFYDEADAIFRTGRNKENPWLLFYDEADAIFRTGRNKETPWLPFYDEADAIFRTGRNPQINMNMETSRLSMQVLIDDRFDQFCGGDNVLTTPCSDRGAVVLPFGNDDVDNFIASFASDAASKDLPDPDGDGFPGVTSEWFRPSDNDEMRQAKNRRVTFILLSIGQPPPAGGVDTACENPAENYVEQACALVDKFMQWSTAVDPRIDAESQAFFQRTGGDTIKDDVLPAANRLVKMALGGTDENGEFPGCDVNAACSQGERTPIFVKGSTTCDLREPSELDDDSCVSAIDQETAEACFKDIKQAVVASRAVSEFAQGIVQSIETVNRVLDAASEKLGEIKDLFNRGKEEEGGKEIKIAAKNIVRSPNGSGNDFPNDKMLSQTAAVGNWPPATPTVFNFFDFVVQTGFGVNGEYLQNPIFDIEDSKGLAYGVDVTAGNQKDRLLTANDNTEEDSAVAWNRNWRFDVEWTRNWQWGLSSGAESDGEGEDAVTEPYEPRLMWELNIARTSPRAVTFAYEVALVEFSGEDYSERTVRSRTVGITAYKGENSICDGLDDDCDGDTDEDDLVDCARRDSSGGCNDKDEEVSPGEREGEAGVGVDNDCDGIKCDGKDDDCDGKVENCPDENKDYSPGLININLGEVYGNERWNIDFPEAEKGQAYENEILDLIEFRRVDSGGDLLSAGRIDELNPGGTSHSYDGELEAFSQVISISTYPSVDAKDKDKSAPKGDNLISINIFGEENEDAATEAAQNLLSISLQSRRTHPRRANYGEVTHQATWILRKGGEFDGTRDAGSSSKARLRPLVSRQLKREVDRFRTTSGAIDVNVDLPVGLVRARRSSRAFVSPQPLNDGTIGEGDDSPTRANADPLYEVSPGYAFLISKRAAALQSSAVAFDACIAAEGFVRVVSAANKDKPTRIEVNPEILLNGKVKPEDITCDDIHRNVAREFSSGRRNINQSSKFARGFARTVTRESLKAQSKATQAEHALTNLQTEKNPRKANRNEVIASRAAIQSSESASKALDAATAALEIAFKNCDMAVAEIKDKIVLLRTIANTASYASEWKHEARRMADGLPGRARALAIKVVKLLEDDETDGADTAKTIEIEVQGLQELVEKLGLNCYGTTEGISPFYRRGYVGVPTGTGVGYV